MKPDVSVVMAAYDDAAYLAETIDSVLSQAGPSLELVVVDDGSRDDSRGIVERYATADPRVRLVAGEHQGLTRALIRGCRLAAAGTIARQDVADVSRPGRLAAQKAALDADPALAFVSCWTDVCGPEWEFLYARRGTGAARRPVDAVDRAGGRATLLDAPTHHGSVMFRKAAYDRAGGYRSEFYLAQDRDLWFRLAEVGRLQVLDQPLYAARVLPASRTATHREIQHRLGRLARRAFELRQAGEPEEPAIAEARGLVPDAVPDDGTRAATYYFIGEALRRNRDARAIAYFRKALAHDALDARTWTRLAQAGLGLGWRR